MTTNTVDSYEVLPDEFGEMDNIHMKLGIGRPNPLVELDRRQNDVLERLDRLNAEIESILSECGGARTGRLNGVGELR